MLKTQLQRTFEKSDLTLTGVKDVFRSVLSYSLSFINAKELRNVAKQYNVEKSVMAIKQGFLDSHPYMLSKFWRGVWWFSKTSNMAEAVTKYSVSEHDLYLAKDFLPKDKFEQYGTVESVAYEIPVTEKRKLELLNKLMPYIVYMASTKLEFISRYDIAASKADLTGEMVADALHALHVYDYIQDEQKLLNYVRRSIHNMVMKLIGNNTTTSRQRIKKVTEEHIGASKHELKVLKKNSITQFQTTTLSIDKPMGNDEEGSFSLSSILADQKQSALHEVEFEDFYSNLVVSLSRNEMRFVKIIFGHHDEEFDTWLQVNADCRSEDLIFNILVRYAFKFTGVDRAILQRKLVNNDCLNRRTTEVIYGYEQN